jgi:murein DD-endopeptidase MepM/ murein hydrolase activator NlpD
VSVAAASTPARSTLTVTNLTVLGARVATRPGSRIAVGDWAVLELGAPVAGAPSVGGVAGSATMAALRLRLVAPHRGVPAGTVVVVGRVSASGSPPPLPRPPAPPAAAPRVTVAAGQPRLTAGAHAFPLDRPAGVTDTYGAARAGVGWHHGIDLFAPRGTPVLAVASGTLFDVGWNALGGHRLWLRDGSGNTYYYAHLDGYTAAVRDGAPVQAGQPLGTLGSSGDAEHTPPHLHFEIHPSALAALGYDGAIDPTPYLAAWATHGDLPIAATPPLPVQRLVASRPAAFLLGADDR